MGQAAAPEYVKREKTMFTRRNHILEQKTKEFIQTLTETPELKAFVKAQDNFNNDERAKKLLADFQNTQQTCAVFRQGSFPGVEDQEKRLRDLQHRLQQNPKIKNLVESQRDLQLLISDLVNQISQGINFPFVPPRGTGGCC